MRSASDLVFKITTMPYRHHTLDTDVVANINIGHVDIGRAVDKLAATAIACKSPGAGAFLRVFGRVIGQLDRDIPTDIQIFYHCGRQGSKQACVPA